MTSKDELVMALEKVRENNIDNFLILKPLFKDCLGYDEEEFRDDSFGNDWRKYPEKYKRLDDPSIKEVEM